MFKAFPCSKGYDVKNLTFYIPASLLLALVGMVKLFSFYEKRTLEEKVFFLFKFDGMISKMYDKIGVLIDNLKTQQDHHQERYSTKSIASGKTFTLDWVINKILLYTRLTS